MKNKLSLSLLIVAMSALFTFCKKSDSTDSKPTPPVANFTFSQSTTVYGAVNFTNTSTNATTYSWSFGQHMNNMSATSTAENPTFVYSNQNGGSSNLGYLYSYTVTLTVSGPGGTNTILKTVTFTNYAYIEIGGVPVVVGVNAVDSATYISITGCYSNPCGGGYFTVNLPPHASVGTYSTTNPTVGLDWRTPSDEVFANSLTTCSSGSVTITSISSTQITGTFKGTLIGHLGCSDSIVITDGAFGANFFTE